MTEQEFDRLCSEDGVDPEPVPLVMSANRLLVRLGIPVLLLVAAVAAATGLGL